MFSQYEILLYTLTYILLTYFFIFEKINCLRKYCFLTNILQCITKLLEVNMQFENVQAYQLEPLKNNFFKQCLYNLCDIYILTIRFFH